MVRVLQIIGSLDRAGAETFLLNLYRNIDRSKVQFDFAIYEIPSENSYYDEVISMGARVFMLPKKTPEFFKNWNTIVRLVRDSHYQIAWRHTDSWVGGIDLLAAKKGGANRRIMHSHNSDTQGMERQMHYLLRPYINTTVTDRFACDIDAGQWMFSKKKYEVIRNGIDTSSFRYNKAVDEEYRKKFHFGRELVIGHVGRFHPVKNQRFVVDVFEALLNVVSDARLLLIGIGADEAEIKKIVQNKKMEERVLFLGSRSDMPELFQMMDVLIMPSLYEGFPVTLLEAQAAGLPCIISDTITPKVDVTGNIKFLSLSSPKSEWAKCIAAYSGKKDKDADQKVRQSGYDIRDIAKGIECKLLEMAKD